MLRRNIRQRREYLYRKNLEGKERLQYEKKRKIQECLQQGKPIPTELRNEEASLRKEIDLEDDLTAVPRSHIDDEYANASLVNPRILITTSRNPSAPLQQFSKELKIVFPNSERMNRGGQVEAEIVESCRDHGFTDVIFINETRGRPDRLVVSHLPLGPTAHFALSNVVTRHDIKDKKSLGKMSEAYPHLVLENFTSKIAVERIADSVLGYKFTDYMWFASESCQFCTFVAFKGGTSSSSILLLPSGGYDKSVVVNTGYEKDCSSPSMLSSTGTDTLKEDDLPEGEQAAITNELKNLLSMLGQRTLNILKHLFPAPKPDSKRIITFVNQSDYISFRHHVYEKQGGPKSVELKEVGPRFEMHLYKITLGTVDQSEAQVEWVLRPYMNTAKKHKALGE